MWHFSQLMRCFMRNRHFKASTSIQPAKCQCHVLMFQNNLAPFSPPPNCPNVNSTTCNFALMQHACVHRSMMMCEQFFSALALCTFVIYVCCALHASKPCAGISVLSVKFQNLSSTAFRGISYQSWTFIASTFEWDSLSSTDINRAKSVH